MSFGDLLIDSGFDPAHVSIHSTKSRGGWNAAVRLTFARPREPRFSVRIAWNLNQEATLENAEQALLDILKTAKVRRDFPEVKDAP